MNKALIEISAAQTQAVSELYRTAAQELLMAYQRNKEATRHHDRGAFRAALHHARLSCVHAAAASDCLSRALEQSGRLSPQDPVALGYIDRIDGIDGNDHWDH
jgi:hypothetical protein